MILNVRKLPIPVEAVQFTGSEENGLFLEKWSNKQCWQEGLFLKVQCLEALAVTPVGSYVVKGVKGEVWPIREDIFNETYEILGGGDQ